MQIRRAADYRRSRWKNGSGETAEIVVAPPGAGLETFDWRISMASVATDGPFSIFPGIDRTLSILEGSGITLRLGEQSGLRLDTTSEPFAFSGDVAASATLVNGPVTDFNVMTRRLRFSHTVCRLQLATGDRLTSDGGATVVFCGAGTLEFVRGTESERVDRWDTLILDEAEASDWILSALVPATLYVVALSTTES